MTTKRLLRLPQVLNLTGLSRSSIYDKMGKGEFPLKVKLGPRAVGWDADEINAWIIEQIERSRGDDS